MSRGVDLVFAPEKYIADDLKSHGIPALNVSLYGKPTFDNYVTFFSQLVTKIWDSNEVKTKAEAWENKVTTAINDVKTEYYISTSSKILTGGSWSTNPPTIKVGKYIWQRTKTVTVSGTISYSTPVCVNNDGYTIMLSNETLLLKCDSEGRVI